MEALRRTFRLIRVNWRTLVCFELFYKAAVAVEFTLLVSLGFRLVMRVMGLSYLTREGIGGFLLHPLTLTLLVSLALLAPFLSLSMLCGLLATVSLPEIVQEFIRLNPLPFTRAHCAWGCSNTGCRPSGQPDLPVD